MRYWLLASSSPLGHNPFWTLASLWASSLTMQNSNQYFFCCPTQLIADKSSCVHISPSLLYIYPPIWTSCNKPKVLYGRLKLDLSDAGICKRDWIAQKKNLACKYLVIIGRYVDLL